jgi:hypothetical protein
LTTLLSDLSFSQKKIKGQMTEYQYSRINKESDDIQLVVSGEGANQNDAIENALRNAIEQTYGTFVSANTTLLNDDLVKDEIVTVTSGNIKGFKILSSDPKQNGFYSVTVSVIVSIGKLVSFAQSHGASTEIAGAAFAMNMKMRKLNADNEYKALVHLRDQVKELCSYNIYDYKISASEPQFNNGEYVITVSITAKPNKNFSTTIDIIKNTLESLRLSEKEVQSYHNNNYPCFQIYGNDDMYEGFSQTTLRNSPIVVQSLLSDIYKFFYFAANSFVIEAKLEKTNYRRLSFDGVYLPLMYIRGTDFTGFRGLNTETKYYYTENQLSKLKGFTVTPRPDIYAEQLSKNYDDSSIYDLRKLFGGAYLDIRNMREQEYGGDGILYRRNYGNKMGRIFLIDYEKQTIKNWTNNQIYLITYKSTDFEPGDSPSTFELSLFAVDKQFRPVRFLLKFSNGYIYSKYNYSEFYHFGKYQLSSIELFTEGKPKPTLVYNVKNVIMQDKDYIDWSNHRD